MPAYNVEALGETLIPVVSKLQEILLGAHLSSQCAVDLPQVAVVGSQSSGKSSVLESLVGRDFLPRGPDICTRRPLLLHLRRLPQDRDGKQDKQEWAEFPSHLPGRKFTDFDEVRKEIVAETDRLLGKDNKDISPTPIHLMIHSPNVLTMSLVDLPGMTRVPVRGQRDDIAEQLKSLIMEHIRSPSCIILAVSAANTDLANSDAIMLARSVDPQGERTIGVLTKLDIMDRGTDAVPMLKNQVLPLKLGYIGVVNRAQADVAAGTLITAAHRAEQEFFDSNPTYRSVRAQCGVPALAHRIKAILVQHIRQRLPQLKAEIESKVAAQQAELEGLGGAAPDLSPPARGELLLRLLNGYHNCFTGLLNGRDGHIAALSGLHGGARIRHVFCEIFCPTIDNLEACGGLSNEQIWNTINNCTGVRSKELVSTAAFEVLVRRAIGLLRKPMHHCAQLISQELLRIAHLCTPPEVSRFPLLDRKLEETVRDFIVESLAPTERMLTDLYDCEQACINCDHPEFLGAKGAIREVMDERQAAKASAQKRSGRSSRPHSRSPAPNGHSYHTSISRDAMGVHDEHSASAPNLSEGGHEVENHGFWFSSLFGGRRNDSGSSQDSGEAVRGFPRSANSFLNGQRPATAGPAALSLAAVLHHPGSDQGDVTAVEGPNLPSAPAQLHSKITTETQVNEVLVMRKMVNSYFAIVRRNMSDLVPKIITKFMVVNAENRLHGHLIHKLYRSELFEELMREHPDTVARRERCAHDLDVLSQAAAQLQSIPAELAAQALPEPSQQQPSDGLSPSHSRTYDSPFAPPRSPLGGSSQGVGDADVIARVAQQALARQPDDLERMSYNGQIGSVSFSHFETAVDNAVGQ